MTLSYAAEALRLQVDQPWREHAACTGRGLVMDPPAETVAAARDLGTDRRLWEKAKAICRTCPVYAECQAWVLSLPGDRDLTGVCGGLTQDQRHRLRASRTATATWRRRKKQEESA